MKRFLLALSFVVSMVIVGCGDKSDVEVDTKSTGSDSAVNGGSGNGTIDGEISSRGNTSGGDNSLYSVYFGFDRFIIEGTKNVETIKNNAKLIEESGLNVRVEGNTDEWGSDEYNYALALKRASAVKDALIGNGIVADKISLVSYGESKPLCTEKTRECWRENRRADFVLTK